MIPEAPYLFSISALSVTLAGFAGLVAAFRRGSELMPIDIYRLRQIAEFTAPECASASQPRSPTGGRMAT